MVLTASSVKCTDAKWAGLMHYVHVLYEENVKWTNIIWTGLVSWGGDLCLMLGSV